MQLNNLHSQFDFLQSIYGDKNLNSIYGAGETNNPKIMFIFMNPTGRNISSNPNWSGLRAPWIGTKQVWDIFYELGFLNEDIYKKIKTFKPNEWEESFAYEVYKQIEKSDGYITNLAKCTQIDARPLSNKIFREYLNLMYQEIEIIKPNKIVTFGNQVSSILLQKNVSVSRYDGEAFETLNLKKKYSVFPTYYPVGQGRRNMSKAIGRIKELFRSLS